MITADLFSIALDSMRTHKLRSFLNLFGIIIAVTTIIAVISVVSGLNKYASDIISGLGPNTLIFDRFGLINSREAFFEALKRKDITDEDVEAVRRLVPQARRVTGRVFSTHPVYAGGKRLADVPIAGAGPELPWMIGAELDEGRFFDQGDDDGARPVAVIGWDIKDELYPGVDPVGRMIQIEGKPFRVAGTLARQGSTFGQSQDRVVLIPLRAYYKAFGLHRSLSIFVEAPSPAAKREIEDSVRQVLRARRGTRFSDPDPFGIIDAEALNTLWRTITFGAFALVIVISSISLVVGGVAIANTMFAAVVERTHEIGVRKALGARPRDLRRQFLIEAVSLSLVGGLVGVFIGWLASLAVGAWSPFPAQLTFSLVATALIVATLSGLAAGWLPAIRAARLDPIVALRAEQ